MTTFPPAAARSHRLRRHAPRRRGPRRPQRPDRHVRRDAAARARRRPQRRRHGAGLRGRLQRGDRGPRAAGTPRFGLPHRQDRCAVRAVAHRWRPAWSGCTCRPSTFSSSTTARRSRTGRRSPLPGRLRPAARPDRGRPRALRRDLVTPPRRAAGRARVRPVRRGDVPRRTLRGPALRDGYSFLSRARRGRHRVLQDVRGRQAPRRHRGYSRPLQSRPRGKVSSGGADDGQPRLPRLTVAECLRYTLTLDPDVALLASASQRAGRGLRRRRGFRAADR